MPTRNVYNKESGKYLATISYYPDNDESINKALREERLNPENVDVRPVDVETLSGHTSEDTAFVVEDYPYGFRLRTQIRYWIETKKGHGQRFVSQTLNPKTGKWNKPKAGTYGVLIVMTRNPENGHIHTAGLSSGGWSKEEDIQAFETKHAAAIGDYERAAIKYIRASNKANDMIKVEIHAARPGEVSQTRDEQAAIYNAALRLGYSQIENGE